LGDVLGFSNVAAQLGLSVTVWGGGVSEES
jgi:hypothetical protein